MKVGAKRLELIAPALGVLADDRHRGRALRQALVFVEIDLLSQTCARVAAGVSDQRPADRRAALAVVVHVLFGDIGVVPQHFLVEPAGIRVMLQLDDLGANDPLEPVQDDAGPQSVKTIRPVRSVAQAHGVVIAVRIAKPQEQSPGGLDAEVSMSSFRSSPMAAALRRTTRCSCRRMIP